MKPYDTYDVLDAKLTKLLTEENLVHKVVTKRGRFILIVRPDQDPSAQMTIYSAYDGASAIDASLEFHITEPTSKGLRYKFTRRFYITDALFTKIKKYAKDLAFAYTFGYFAENSITDAEPFEADNDDLLLESNECDDLDDSLEENGEENSERLSEQTISVRKSWR